MNESGGGVFDVFSQLNLESQMSCARCGLRRCAGGGLRGSCGMERRWWNWWRCRRSW